MITYREAKKNELNKIVELLTQSFFNYDYYKMYVQNEKRRFHFVRIIQELCVKTSFEKGYIILVGIIDNIIVSVAILIPPNARKISVWDYVFSGGIKLLFCGGIRNSFGFLGMLEEGNSVCHKEYPNSWYLEPFAVSNTFQGQGIGSKMLNDCIKPYISKHGGGLFTFITNSEKNRVFYKKNGFTEFHGSEIHRNNKVLGNWSFKLPIDPER